LKDIRIYFIGDSYVNGTGDPLYLGWPGRVCAASQTTEHSITCYNLGVRADTSVDILRRWEQELKARLLKPHDCHIVFSFGANDCWIENEKKRVSTFETRKNAAKIFEQARSLFPTLMIGPPPGIDQAEHERRVAISTLLKKVTKNIDIPYLEVIHELHDGGLWQQEALLGDRIHPAEGGYGALADLVLAWDKWWFHQ
tara:strand:+ start:372 stop:965 length:594 start_codon:yes stop_codon:yes gene_type:complete